MPRSTPPPSKRRPPPPRPRPAKVTEDVDPRWLLKAIGGMLLLAALCGYFTLCLLFYQGQWQLVLHPARTSSSQPPVAGAEPVRFAADESAVPQLSGWWIPAPSGSRYSQTTILFLPPGDGSLADSAALLASLHSVGIGINIFAFDYRGYGQSASAHPSQRNMTEDVENAWRYLTISRSLAGRQVVPYGVGVGASLATHLAASHPEIPALILESDGESPQADLLEAARRDPRSKLIPLGMLFHEDFPLAAPLARLKTPKLLLSVSRSPSAFKTASDPKATVEFNAAQGAPYSQPSFPQAIRRFLDQYLPPGSAPPPLLKAPPQP